MRILLQFPEGLKKLAFEEAGKLEKQGHEVFVSCSPCFGACDIALDEARAVKAGKIIHWGHSDFGVRGEIPVEYREHRIDANMNGVLPKALKKLEGFERVGLITTVQHVGHLGELRSGLEAGGKKVAIGKGKKARYPGQVLGCDAGAAKGIEGEVDCFVYFGGGLFHPLIDSEKRVLRADPFSGRVEWLDREIEIAKRRRKGGMLVLAGAKDVGVLISTKPGQLEVERAREVKLALEGVGKRCLVLVSNTFDFQSVSNLGSFDCYVNTACPRLADDRELSGKPIINYSDAIEVARISEGKE